MRKCRGRVSKDKGERIKDENGKDVIVVRKSVVILKRIKDKG